MPDWPMVPLLFVSLFAVALMSSALGIALSAVNVYLRDMSHLIEVILTAWFWACPIVYSYAHSIAPHLHNAAIKILYLMNPMTPVVMTSQRVIYAHPVVHLTTNGAAEQILPSWSSATYIAMNFGLVAFGLVLMVIALTIFGRLEGNFAEEL
jgi:ABC-2 type transport system permease protein